MIFANGYLCFDHLMVTMVTLVCTQRCNTDLVLIESHTPDVLGFGGCMANKTILYYSLAL